MLLSHSPVCPVQEKNVRFAPVPKKFSHREVPWYGATSVEHSLASNYLSVYIVLNENGPRTSNWPVDVVLTSEETYQRKFCPYVDNIEF